MSGKRSRDKGHNWEREVARRFREIFGSEVRRGLQSRSGGEAPDVEVPCFWVECKRGKQTNPKAALRQATEGASSDLGLTPIAICKDDRQRAVVMMDFDDFLELVGEWWQLSNR